MTDNAGKAVAILLIGYIADDENCYQEAEDLYRDGTALCGSIVPDEPELVATGHHLIGCTLYHQGNFDEADKEFRRADTILNENPSPDLTDLKARNDRRRGSVALKLGRLREAEKFFKSVQELLKQAHRPRDAARIARHLGELYLERDDLEAAERALEEALNGFEALGAVRGVGYTHRCMATLRRKQGNLDEAQSLCERSRKIAKKTGSLYGEAAGCEELAAIFQAAGSSPQAVNRLKLRARNIYVTIEHKREAQLTQHLKEIGAMDLKLPAGIKGVLFDLMDTLAYLEPGIYERTQERFADRMKVSIERFRLAWTESRKRASTGVFKTTADRLHWVKNKLGTKILDSEILPMADEMEMMWQRHVRLFPGTSEFLKELRESGIQSAIVSNGPVAMAGLQKSLGLDRLVNAFIMSCEAAAMKPQTPIYQEALKRLKMIPGQCIFVGDGNDCELDGARDVGLFTVKIIVERPPYGNLKNESIDWDIEVNDLGQLRALFQETGIAASS